MLTVLSCEIVTRPSRHGDSRDTTFLRILAKEGSARMWWQDFFYVVELPDLSAVDLSGFDITAVRTALFSRPEVRLGKRSAALAGHQWDELRARVWPSEEDDEDDRLSDLELLAGEDTPRRFRRNEPV